MSTYERFMGNEEERIKLQVAMPMRLYKLSTISIIVLMISFFIVVGIATITSTTKKYNFYDELKSSQTVEIDMKEYKEFVFSVTNLTKLNQELWLNLVPIKQYEDPGIIWHAVNISVKVSSVKKVENEVVYEVIKEIGYRTRPFNCLEKALECQPVVVLHIPIVDSHEYQATIGIEKKKEYEDFGANISIYLEWKTYNSSFTLFEIFFRFSLLLITLIATLLFGFQLKNHPYKLWSIEQKWTLMLLASLIGFNNPLYPLTIHDSGKFVLFLDILLQVSFLCFLLFYWLCVFHGIRVITKKREFANFYLPKLIIVGIVWLSMIVASTWEHFHQLDDPSYQNISDIPGFVFFQSVFGIFLFFYLFAVLFYIFRAAGEMRKLPFLDIRVKFLATITFFMISVCIGGAVASVFYEFDVSNIYFAFYIMFNTYVYLLTFVYSPANKNPKVTNIEFSSMTALTDESDQEIFESQPESTSTNSKFGNMRKRDD